MEEKSSINRKHRLRQWVEERWPLSAVVRWGSVEKIPGGAKFAYVLGSATLFLFTLLVVTGVWQLLYYVPAVDHAYDSVMYLRLQVPFGWLVHGLHYWAAQAFIVVMGLHMARVFIWAAYKKPRELIWVLGVVLLLLAAAFIFTGAILPWDTTGYWAGEVGTNIAGTVPLVGRFLKLLMRGGDTMGQMTLSRAFAVHTAILPVLTVSLIAAHLVAFRQFGSIGPWNPRKLEKTGWFWPHQVFKDLLVVMLILVALICLSAFFRAPISGPADPLDNSYTPKPEWNFLFLYQALKAFKGSWEWIGTTIIPSLLVLLLFAVPFIDRNERRNPRRRPVAMLCGFLFVAVILVLTFIGHYSDSGAANGTGGAQSPAAQAPAAAASAPSPATSPSISAKTPAPAPGAPAPTQQGAPVAASASPAKPAAGHSSDSQEGRSLFVSAACATCHAIEGKGGKLAPDLSHEANLGRTSPWLIKQITDPAKHNPSTVMPAHKDLTERQLKGLADYILNPTAGGGGATAVAPDSEKSQTHSFPERQQNPAPANAATVNAGHGIYRGWCQACHGPTGTGDGSAAVDLSKKVSDLSLPTMWAYSDGQLFGKITDGQGQMPRFESLLTATQRWDVVNYIRTLAPKPAGFQTKKPSADTTPQAKKQPSASSANPAEEKQGTASDSSDSTTPATGAPGTPEAVLKMIGDADHGAVLFNLDCAKCHGKAGEGHVPNPGSLAGVVSPLAPIARRLFSDDAIVFSANIDRIIQHGASPPGPAPELMMPAFGDTKSITPQETVNIEAYVLSLNGVDAAKIIHPGIAPLRFVEGTLALFALAFLAIGGLWVGSRASSSAESSPNPEEYQNLKNEVADLKHKLDVMETKNPKDATTKKGN